MKDVGKLMVRTTLERRKLAYNRAVKPVIVRCNIRTNSTGLVDLSKGVMVYSCNGDFKLYTFKTMEGALRQAYKLDRAKIVAGGRNIEFCIADKNTAYYIVEKCGIKKAIMVAL